MAKDRKLELELPTLDDLFTTQEERDDAKLKRIYELPIDEIDDFPDHPFQVRDDEDMFNLVQSITENGLLTPVTVRKKEDGRYELLSGHRRKRACELAGIDTLRADVVEMDRDAATIFMVDSNLQRTIILPSEKAFSYKMRLDAMKRQGQRNDLTCAPLEHKLQGVKSRDILADQVGEGKENVRRYIRLTHLVPELLDLVDRSVIALRPAVELSYLTKNQQYDLFEVIDEELATPSHSQSIRLRKLSEQKELTPEIIRKIILEVKPNQRERYVIHSDRIKNLFPKDIKESEREEYIVKALEHYAKVRERKSRDLER